MKKQKSKLRKMSFNDKWMQVKVSFVERVDGDFEVQVKNRAGFTEDFYITKPQASKLTLFLKPRGKK